MIQEFKDFINKGGVFETAVGLILALAFQPIIDSVVNDIVTPIIARIVGQPDFSELAIGLGDKQTPITYGNLIAVTLSFIMTAFVLFMLVKVYNKTQATKQEDAAGPSEVDLLTEIRDHLANR